MSLLRWLSRVSIAEWLLIGLAIAWLVRGRPPASRAAPAGQPRRRDWVIDGCVVVALIGLIGGAFWHIAWLSLLGFAAAALGLALAIRAGALRIAQTVRRWMQRLTRR